MTELLDGDDLGNREDYVAKSTIDYQFTIPDESSDDWNTAVQSEFQARLDSEDDAKNNGILLNK